MSSFGHGFRRSGQRREADQHDFTQATLPGKQPVITSIIRDFSAEALSELRQWLEANPPAIPIYQLPGFSQTVPQIATVITAETTTSVPFVNLATVGPTIPNLPTGKYLILCSALMFNNTAGAASLMGIVVNGTVLGDANAAIIAEATTVILGGATPVGMAVANLTLESNTIRGMYRVNTAGSTGTFQYRNIIAIRLANA